MCIRDSTEDHRRRAPHFVLAHQKERHRHAQPAQIPLLFGARGWVEQHVQRRLDDRRHLARVGDEERPPAGVEADKRLDFIVRRQNVERRQLAQQFHGRRRHTDLLFRLAQGGHGQRLGRLVAATGARHLTLSLIHI